MKLNQLLESHINTHINLYICSSRYFLESTGRIEIVDVFDSTAIIKDGTRVTEYAQIEGEEFDVTSELTPFWSAPLDRFLSLSPRQQKILLVHAIDNNIGKARYIPFAIETDPGIFSSHSIDTTIAGNNIAVQEIQSQLKSMVTRIAWRAARRAMLYNMDTERH